MKAEYQRLEAGASEVQNQIDELVKSCEQMVAGAITVPPTLWTEVLAVA